MFTNNHNKENHDNVPLRDRGKLTNPPISCVVSHRVSIRTKSTIKRSQILKTICCIFLTLSCVIGCIIVFVFGRTTNSNILLTLNESVNGEWSNWNAWSDCNISCSSSTQPFGSMSRVRICNSPPPQRDDRTCHGISQEITQCFKLPCSDLKSKIESNWSDWNQWSACSASCQSLGSIPRQNSSRSCFQDMSCRGESLKERLCTWLPECQVDVYWGDWHVESSCKPVNSKLCATGKMLFKRKCIKSNPILSKDCEGSNEKYDDCWHEIGCPSALQPPRNITVFSNGTGMFEINWLSVPYGVTADKYRLYLTVEDKKQNQLETVILNVTAIPTKNVAGRSYRYVTNLLQFLSSGQFEILIVRMSSLDYWGNESSMSGTVQSNVAAVDGQWGAWDHWTECSTSCLGYNGVRYRRRYCDNPKPSIDGKPCDGLSEENLHCIGMEKDCKNTDD